MSIENDIFHEVILDNNIDIRIEDGHYAVYLNGLWEEEFDTIGDANKFVKWLDWSVSCH